ncbi:MAG: hypothetical protein A3J09_00400 [Candidatus Zambryskibacteria bacterium RIFCSPLOWO2_02_FULL_51_21]|uniref:Uncharacterized protein n=1 Tax=Candidatus Zambryskibacteria bacterium RIFCSPHIGHO2_02_FULL_43_37 TaxID=1802749 RepID=A0A1G2TI90_9BACT|nr:MAG: hypothetical protein A3D49_02300 [Candidatus Zambryskibacteria bacterium RIFCSPHIGHO2_02_FULL_43_37]OHB06694.1 MAG: hypothetical protein A2944_02490 [Candidatus Zambryskibacteria bacterium RIFCSPLOWO2_01_FULL_52_12]OHB11026.1 MAG: hypothetical protein A3J09_00400 [Candidatus Zambryskibacteria bacterium RIFCSPLOWO2_02_FULL_51_21]
MNTDPRTFGDIVQMFLDLVLLLVPLVASLALLAFFWGLAKFIYNVSGDEKAVGEGKNLMKWGLIALFVMVSVWGILRFAYGELGFSGFGVPFLPTNK